MTKGNRIVDMETLTTWMLISLMGAALAIAGGIIGSWALLAASCACLLIFITKVAKFHTPPHRAPKGLSTTKYNTKRRIK